MGASECGEEECDVEGSLGVRPVACELGQHGDIVRRDEVTEVGAEH